MKMLRTITCLFLGFGLARSVAFAGDAAASLAFTKLGSYSAGHFSDETSAAEIVGYDAKMQRLYVVNGAQRTVDVLDARDPSALTKLFAIDCTPFGDQPNSVAVRQGVVAVAVQALPKTSAGQAVFFDADGNLLSAVRVGALPDMICFTPNGHTVLVANEGEPDDTYAIDPEGSISVIDVRGNMRKLRQTDVRTATFTAFNDQKDQLDPSIRIFGLNASVAQDLEPEYIAVSEDSRTAFVTLQENNAVAEVDLRTASVVALRGLGFKDHAAVAAVTERFEFDPTTLPTIGSTAAGQPLFLGGFSGLAFEGVDAATGRLKFITHTDRGPNGEPTGIQRPFLLPGFAPEIVRFQLDRASGELAITQRIPLQRAAGSPLTGLPNLTLGSDASQPYNDEVGVDLFNVPTGVDPLGGDFEGIVVDPIDGSFWMCDEYRPGIYHFTPTGILIARYVPIGTAASAGQPPGTFGVEVLPAVLAQRRQNRGFEAIAWDAGKIYAWVQSPVRNPASLPNGVLNGLKNVRVVEFNPATLAVRQFVYVMDNAAAAGADDTRADKIGDAVGLGGGEFLLVERDDDSVTSMPADPLLTIQKKIYRLNLAGATELTPAREAALLAATGKTVDQATVAELTANGINPVGKVLQVDLTRAGYDTVQKVEGLAVIDPWTIAVINDNDFQVAGIAIDNTTGTFSLLPSYVPEPITLGLLDLQGNGLDASDRDNRINIRPWPVRGMFLPDAIAAFRVKGVGEFLITANEGDVRQWGPFDEEARIGGLSLDPTVFPFGGTLKNNAQLGRLKVTNKQGDHDGDGDFDALYSFGGRSFSIWNRDGSQVFDSGDALEQIIATDLVFAPIFNAGHTNNARDDRSDDKGPEPEAIATGTIGKVPYVFVGLERIGGFMVFDLSDPTAPRFVSYVNSRDPTVTPAVDNGSDYGPEGLLFIDAKESPVDAPLLVVANEVSGTTTVFRIDVATQ